MHSLAWLFSCETFTSDLIPLSSPLRVHWTDGRWQAAVDELHRKDCDCMMQEISLAKSPTKSSVVLQSHFATLRPRSHPFPIPIYIWLIVRKFACVCCFSCAACFIFMHLSEAGGNRCLNSTTVAQDCIKSIDQKLKLKCHCECIERISIKSFNFAFVSKKNEKKNKKNGVNYPSMYENGSLRARVLHLACSH